MQIEKTLNYNPKKVTTLKLSQSERSLLLDKIMLNSKSIKPNFRYITQNECFIACLTETEPYRLFTIKADYDYLHSFADNDLIPRRITYFYPTPVEKKCKVVQLNDSDLIHQLVKYLELDSIINIEAEEIIKINNQQFMKLHMSNKTCEISNSPECLSYSDLTPATTSYKTYDNQIFQFQENADYIHKRLNLQINIDKITKETLDSLAESIFDMIQESSIRDLFFPVCSMLTRYCILNNFSGPNLTKYLSPFEKNQYDTFIEFNVGDKTINIQDIVSTTFSRMNYYEFNPRKYFILPAIASAQKKSIE